MSSNGTDYRRAKSKCDGAAAAVPKYFGRFEAGSGRVALHCPKCSALS